jgi:hypothetical protein
MSTRHDMLVELVTDQINSIEQMIRDDEYQDVHNWLHPILLRELKLDYADWSDAELQDYYCDQLGVDIPSSPSLSSTDEEEEVDIEAYFGKSPSQETANRGSLPEPSGVERSKVSDVHSICDEKGVAEMAATLRGIVSREETVHGLQPTTEVRIPVRLLLRLVHGEGCIG